MDSKTAHTPTPWNLGPIRKAGLTRSVVLGPLLATLTSFTRTDGQFEANAALIVKAVNCHAELVEALELVVEQSALLNQNFTWIKVARTILAKVEAQ